MKRIICLLFICITASKGSFAQSANYDFEKEFNKAEELFSKVGDNKKSASTAKDAYAGVIPLLLNLQKKEPDNRNISFKLGVCYLGSRKAKTQAIPHLEKAIRNTSDNYNGDSYKEKNAPFLAHKLLADAYHLNYQFDKAITAYEKYISVMAENKSTDKITLEESKRKIEMCKTGLQLVASPVKVKMQNLGAGINSPYADYSMVLSADQNTMFFTSRRPETTGIRKDEEGNSMEDIFMSERTKTGWSKAKNIGAPINSEWHEATVGISPDGQNILIYKDDMGDGNIYSTTLDGDNWGEPIKLNENINSKHWEPSACISADGNTIYFTSDRPGGYGGRDLYVSNRSYEGEWETAKNLGPAINTALDEDAPFIHPDGVSLSFSSNGHNTMGGFDIFSSMMSDDGTWSEPMNVGYPINTTDDDIFYMISPDGRTAYFSSFRPDGLGEKDIYSAVFPDRKETALRLMQGTVVDESGKPARKVKITVTDNETEKVVGIYNTNSKTGKYLFVLTPGRNYNITYQTEGHLFYSENIEIPKQSTYSEQKSAVSLNPIIVGSKITLNNIFFDFDKATLRKTSNVELSNLAELMKSNPNLKVEISGHTDNKGEDIYNQNLSEERARAVVNYLMKKGISSDRMTAKGYGKTKALAPNNKKNGKDDPEGRQLNRRVELEIKEIK